MTKEQCVQMLLEKHKALTEQGIERYPERADFSNEEVVAIKAFLGPWPRALEKAGIKPENPGKKSKKLEKRINAKRKMTQQKLEKQNKECSK